MWALVRRGCCPRWTASADFIILDRIGSVNQTLVETVQGTVKYKDLRHTAGTEVLNRNDFQEGFSGGPRLDLIRHGDNGYDLEMWCFSRSTAGAATEAFIPLIQKIGDGW